MKATKFFLLIALLIGNLFSDTASSQTYIRTVVHVMYENTSQDISDAAILNYINDVNQGFSRDLPAKFTRTPDIFSADWANTSIQLCLATTDPSGNPTTGITHTMIGDKLFPGQSAASPENPVWNPANYLNIYIAPVYSEPGFPNFVLSGWAFTPTNLGHASFSHVIVASNGSPYISEVVTHEVGHYFGLDHLSEDNLADTPKGMEMPMPSVGYSSTCSSAMQSSNTTTLAEDGNHWGGIDPPDMIENFMGLSMPCMFMFTTMQQNLMQSYINTHHSTKIISACSGPNDNEDIEHRNTLTIAPNPSQGEFLIIAPGNTGNFTVTVLDAFGKQLKILNNISPASQIQLTDLPNGIYFLQLYETDTKFNTIKKIVLAR